MILKTSNRTYNKHISPDVQSNLPRHQLGTELDPRFHKADGGDHSYGVQTMSLNRNSKVDSPHLPTTKESRQPCVDLKPSSSWFLFVTL
jgi:hypothetical protein